MSVQLEKLVIEWRDAEKAFVALGDNATEFPVNLMEIVDRRRDARAALLEYAEEEMG